MTREEFYEIMNRDRECLNIDDCTIFLGLSILRNYIPTAGIRGAEHDIVYASPSIDELIEAGITGGDVVMLNNLYWCIEPYGICLCHRV